jgi:uncharacterized membrane protein (DUF2068 family)
MSKLTDVAAKSLDAVKHIPPGKTNYLRAIGIYKFLKGVVLCGVGFSLLFLDNRPEWLLGLIHTVQEAFLEPRNKFVLFLLRHVLDALIKTPLQLTGILSLIYAAVLMTQGVGVYLEKKWAEWLMLLATGSLIPLEVYHFVHKPTLLKAALILANTFLVWYLYRTLRNKEIDD